MNYLSGSRWAAFRASLSRSTQGAKLDIQTLGAFDDPIVWVGTLRFTTALDRAKAIDDMRRAGVLVDFQVGGQSGKVMVSKFHYEYENDFCIPYQIELQPAGLLGSPGAKTTEVPTVTEQSDIIVPPQMARTPMDAKAATGSTTYQTAAMFGASASTPLGAIVSQLSPVVAQTIQTVSQVGHLVSQGETLWSIATQHYGNGNMWTTLAAANSIVNPQAITAGMKIVIPNPSAGAK